MPVFRITVEQISNRLHDHEDIIENPSGTYTIEAEDKETALDYFHDHIPIGCLDDFEITCSEISD